jgi:hypothetical protein
MIVHGGAHVRLAWGAWAIAAFTFAACKPHFALDGGISCPIGDMSKPIEMEIVHRNADGTLATTQDMGTIPLIQPPQGGKVLFIGVRARNLDGCPVLIAPALTDECSTLVAATEERPIILEPTADGWGEPKDPSDINNYSNLAVCPTNTWYRDIDNVEYGLTVRVTDRVGRMASQSLRVRPVCGEPERLAECTCECSANHGPGASCDAGTDASTSCTMDASAGD